MIEYAFHRGHRSGPLNVHRSVVLMRRSAMYRSEAWSAASRDTSGMSLHDTVSWFGMLVVARIMVWNSCRLSGERDDVEKTFV